MSELSLQTQIVKARLKGFRASVLEPCAKSAYYDVDANEIVVLMRNGSKFCFPPHLGQGLQGATAEQLAEVEVSPSGDGLHWEALDADLSIPALVKGMFGTQAWMSELGRQGGKVKSEVKTKAARQNGKKGGRPRKHKFVGC